ANRMAIRPTARVTWPGMSSLRPSGAEESVANWVTAIETTEAATTTRYDSRQSPCEASHPPISGELAAPIESEPAQTWLAVQLDRSSEVTGDRPGHRQQGARLEQSLAAEQVADHAGGQLEDDHRDGERGGDPGQLGAGGLELLLERAVERTGQRVGHLREEDG